MKEELFRLMGMRKVGAIDVPDERDWRYNNEVSKKLRASHSSYRGYGDLPIYYQSQGNTVACSAFGLTHAVACEVVKTFHYLPDIIAFEQWKNQQADNNSTLPEGDSLQSALATGRKHGFYDRVRKVWYDIEYYRVMKNELESAQVNDNATIYTGFLISYPMVDKNYVLKRGGDYGGHAVCSHDWLKLVNSWKGFGIKNTGVCYYTKENFPQMYAAYAITVKPRIIV